MNTGVHPWSSVIATNFRLLTFRATRDELLDLRGGHLMLGTGCAWLVGIGRYWDNPKVGLLQHLGIGSVVYVFVLALFLWLIIWPLKPKNWSYFRVCTFVALVSPPAVLYALPVERYFDFNSANSINVWFLAIVATWRVALLFFFLRRAGQLDWLSVVAGGLLPLTLIVVVLTELNLEKAVFSLMGGLSATERTANDGAFAILQTLSLLSVLLFIPLLCCYLILALMKFAARSSEKDGAVE